MSLEQINATTLGIALPTGDIAEVGDKDSLNFKPTLKLPRWGNECSLTLSIPTTEKILPVIDKEKILWTGKDYGAEFYQATDGLKFNVILPKKPATNVFPLDFDSDNLNFYYQPPLTEEFKNGWSEEFQRDIFVTETDVKDKDGNVLVHRPENVVGSYAVYHNSKSGHVIGQTNYMTGKAFHWYRPLIYDNAGHTCWGILNVGEGIRTVTVPQSFLDSAVYPVVIDDWFGTQTMGTAGESGLGLYGPYRSIFTMGAVGGPGVSISAGISNSNITTDYLAKYAVYTGNNVFTNGLTGTVTIPKNTTTPDWFTANFVTPPDLVANTAYGLAVAANESGGTSYIRIKWDSGGTHGYDTTVWASLWPDPWANDGSGTRIYSIYCTYTPAGGEPAEYIAQTLRIVKALTDYDAQTLRMVESLAGYAGQTKRIITSLAEYIAQTKRVITKLTEYAGQTIRIIKSVTSYSGQTKRVITELVSYIAQTERIIKVMSSYSGQGLRIVKSIGSYIGQTKRVVNKLTGYTGQGLRIVTSQASYIAQTVRNVISEFVAKYIAQTVRIVKSATSYNGQTKRNIVRLASYSAQTVRYILYILVALFNAQTIRKIRFSLQYGRYKQKPFKEDWIGDIPKSGRYGKYEN